MKGSAMATASPIFKPKLDGTLYTFIAMQLPNMSTPQNALKLEENTIIELSYKMVLIGDGMTTHFYIYIVCIL